jgi:polar amino acid transport system substrate-binding protein
MSRADYVIYEEDPALAYAAKLNIGGIRAISSAITNEGLHLTMSHKSPCNTPDMRGRIAKAIYKLEKNRARFKNGWFESGAKRDDAQHGVGTRIGSLQFRRLRGDNS